MMTKSTDSRRGFTLIEILVVLALVAVLTALAAGAFIKVMGSQQTSRSEDGIRKIDKNLRDQWNFVKTNADKEFDSLDPTSSLQAIYALANNDIDRARVLWRIFRITEAFPQSYGEIQNATLPLDPTGSNNTILFKTIYGISAQGPQPPIASSSLWYWIPPERRNNLKTFSNRISTPGAANNKPATQSAACLYLTLTQMNRGGNLRITEEQLPANVADTDGDGVKELVDNFSPTRPLTFIRFPIYVSLSNSPSTLPRSRAAMFLPNPDPTTRLTAPGQPGTNPSIFLGITTEMASFNANAGANAGFGDPLDPTGLLQQKVTVTLFVGGKQVQKVFPWYKAPYTGANLPSVPKSFVANMNNGDVLTQLCSHPFPEAADYATTGVTWPGTQPYYMPIIVSNGADGLYGPFDPNLFAVGQPSDDIVSFRLKVGARGE
jgi:prepilin-type N-terminal cleavage/methylation domain-containing protein